MPWLGVNWLPPVGLMTFSVGEVVVVFVAVVVVVVVDGLLVLLVAQPTADAPNATIATAPAVTEKRRAKRPEFIVPTCLGVRPRGQ
jgi:hypothetical protein